MASLNKVMIIGNLTRDPEVKFLPNGKAVADIGLAINHSYKTESGEKRETVTFVDVTLFGRSAEVIGEYCKKGHPLFVEGRLQLDVWDDKTSGQKRSKLKVIGDTFQFLPTGNKGGDSGGEPSSTPSERGVGTALPPVDDDEQIPM